LVCFALLFSIASVASGQQSAEQLADAERTFLEAERAASAGNYQAAIVALERVLLIDPSLSNIKHKLGLLYLRVGARTRAEFFLREALKDPQMPDDVRAASLAALGSLENGDDAATVLSARSRLSGSIGLTFGFDSNPGSQSRLQRFQTTTVRPNDRRETDSLSLQPSARLAHRLGLGASGRVQWLNRLQVSAIFYDGLESDTGEEVSDLNRTSVGLLSGFDIAVGRPASEDGRRRGRTRPYIDIGFLRRDGEAYQDRFGAGLQLERRGTRVTSIVDLRVDDYQFQGENEFRRDGTRLAASLDLGLRAGSRTSLGVVTRVLRADAEADSERYTEGGIDLRATRVLQATALRRWLGTVSLFASRRVHDEVEGVISLRDEREETLVGVSVSTDLVFDGGFGLRFAVSYLDNDSTLENYQYTNDAASIGVSWRF